MNASDPNASANLKQALSQVHAALSNAPKIEQEAEQLLRRVLADAERVLGRGTGESAPHGVSARVESMAVGFEARHPTLAASLREFAELLGSAGI